MKMRSSVALGATWSLVESLSGQTISFLLFLVLARWLSPVDFGTVAIANLCVIVFQCFIYQGLGQAIVQFADLDDRHLNTIFWLNLGSGGFFFGLVLLIAPAVQHWFHTPGLAGVLCWLAPLFILSGLTDVQNNLLVRHMQFRTLAIRTLLSYLCGGAVGVFLAWRGKGVWSLVGQQLAIGLVNLLVLWSASDWQPRFQFCPKRARRLLSFGMHLLWVDLVNLVSRRADQLFVGRYLGPAAAGFYAVGSRFSMLVSEMLSRSIGRVTLSALSRVQDHEARFTHAFSEIVEAQSALTLPVALGLSLVAPEVVHVFFGEKWSAAIPILQALLLSCPFEALSGAHQAALIARGRPGWSSALTTAHALLNIAFFVVAVHWGAAAVAVAFSIRAALLYPVELLVLSTVAHLPVMKPVRLLFPQVLAAAAMSLSVWSIRNQLHGEMPPLLKLGVAILTGVLIYALALTVVNRPLLTKLRGLILRSSVAIA